MDMQHRSDSLKPLQISMSINTAKSEMWLDRQTPFENLAHDEESLWLRLRGGGIRMRRGSNAVSQ
jgi:hypothetical protein